MLIYRLRHFYVLMLSLSNSILLFSPQNWMCWFVISHILTITTTLQQQYACKISNKENKTARWEDKTSFDLLNKNNKWDLMDWLDLTRYTVENVHNFYISELF